MLKIGYIFLKLFSSIFVFFSVNYSRTNFEIKFTMPRWIIIVA